MENGGDGTPSVVSPGQSWRFAGFVPEAGGAPGDGTFFVDTVEGTYSIDEAVGTDDSPIVNIDNSDKGLYAFEYYIPECDFGTTIYLSNIECEVCLAGVGRTITACSACNVPINLFDFIDNGPANTGTWSHVSGPSTLTFTGAHLGTVNFNGLAVGTYVARYTIVAGCTADVTINVIAQANAGLDKIITACDSHGAWNLQAQTGGDIGTWTVNTLPPVGTVDLINGIYDPATGDGIAFDTTPFTIIFTKTVSPPETIVNACSAACSDTATVTVNVYKDWYKGNNALNNSICNDGSQTRSLRDLLQGEDPGGQWKFAGWIPTGQGFQGEDTDGGYINGSFTTFDIFGAEAAGAAWGENPTYRPSTGHPTGEIRFWYRKNAAVCRSSQWGQVGFLIIDCGTSCNNNPTIVLNTGTAGCVSATRGGTANSVLAETWRYRLSNTGTWLSYTAGTLICNELFVEFELTVTFSNGCPPITKTAIFTQGAQGCNNSPDVTHSLGSCSITLLNSGTTNSPISNDTIQWRVQGNTAWNTYTVPIAFTQASITIEYRRIVSFSDTCPTITTSIKTVTHTCSVTNCQVTTSFANGLISASVTSCNQGVAYQWAYSTNGAAPWTNLGTGQSQAPNSGNGTYRVIVTCGAGTCQDFYNYNLGQECTNNVTVTQVGQNLIASVTGCSGVTTYAWQYSATGTGWVSLGATGNTYTPTQTGWYRVLIWCDGICPDFADIQIQINNCNNNPGVTASMADCTLTITRTGTNNSPIQSDILYYRQQGTTTWFQYTNPISFTGTKTFEYRRIVSYSDGCDTIQTNIQTITDTCAESQCFVEFASRQFQSTQGNCTIDSLTVTTAQGCTVSWDYSSNGSTGWTYIGSGLTVSLNRGRGYYRATATCGAGSCTYTYFNSVCQNAPTVSIVDNSDCTFSLTKGGYSCSTIATDVLQYRLNGGAWINIAAGVIISYPSAGNFTVDAQRTVTYTDGCNTQIHSTSTTKNCTSNCSTIITVINQSGNDQLQATVNNCPSGNPVTYQWFYRAGTSGAWTSLGANQVQNITQGSGYYRAVTTCAGCTSESIYYYFSCINFDFTFTYTTCAGLTVTTTGGTAPFTQNYPNGTKFNNGSYNITVTDANGCQITKVLTVNTCNNTPNVNGFASTCQFSLAPTGTNVSPVATDVIQWRVQGTSTWNTYTAPVTTNIASQVIEYRRIVTYSDCCPTITSVIKTLTVTCSTACDVTIAQITLSGNNALRANVTGCGSASITYAWQYSANGSTGWTSIGSSQDQVASSGNGYYRVTISCGGGCIDTATFQFLSCNNSPGDGITFNQTTCQFTLLKTGTINSPIASDNLYYRIGTSGPFILYTGPTPYVAGQPHYRYRAVTFSDGCPPITTSPVSVTAPGACCLDNNPGVTISYNSQNCTFSFSRTGTNSSPILTDKIYYRVGGSGVWTEYTSGSVTWNGLGSTIYYYRQVTYSDSCPGKTTATSSYQILQCCTEDAVLDLDSVITNCQLVMTKIGFPSSCLTTDVLEYKFSAGASWILYSSPVVIPVGFSGTIYTRRYVQYSCCDPREIPVNIAYSRPNFTPTYNCITGLSYGTVTGGVAPYSYSPAPGTILTAGTHNVIVTDSKGCSTTKTVSASCCPYPNPPTVNPTALVDFVSATRMKIRLTGVSGTNITAKSLYIYNTALNITSSTPAANDANNTTLTTFVSFTNLGSGVFELVFDVPSMFYRLNNGEYLYKAWFWGTVTIKDECNTEASANIQFGPPYIPVGTSGDADPPCSNMFYGPFGQNASGFITSCVTISYRIFRINYPWSGSNNQIIILNQGSYSAGAAGTFITPTFNMSGFFANQMTRCSSWPAGVWFGGVVQKDCR